MDKIGTSWSEEEFKAYILIYAAQTNYNETEEELDFIESYFDGSLLKSIRKEINLDNDYQRIQKIMAYVDKNKYSEKDLGILLDNIKSVYLSDGDFDSTEQTIYYYLKKIFNIS